MRLASALGLVGPIYAPIEPVPNQLKDKITFNPVHAGSFHPDDVYRLTLQTTTGPLNLDVGGSGTVTPPTAAKIVELFGNRIGNVQEENSPLGEARRKYAPPMITVGEGLGASWLVLSPSLIYELTCTKGEQSIDKSVTLTRSQ